jgi:hypothetical protein
MPAFIDPDGLFNGDRMRLLSDLAKLHWPYFWCASNSCGRIELNYMRVCARAWSQFREPPTEEQFWQLIREYHESFLLFVYEYNGQVWGSWDTSEKFLPRHKLAADMRSPAPNYEDFAAWRERYISAKQLKAASNPIDINNFVKLSEKLPEGSQKITADLAHGVGVGVGGGGGVGAGEGGGGGPVNARVLPIKRPPSPAETSDRFEEWISKYPRVADRDGALVPGCRWLELMRKHRRSHVSIDT